MKIKKHFKKSIESAGSNETGANEENKNKSYEQYEEFAFDDEEFGVEGEPEEEPEAKEESKSNEEPHKESNGESKEEEPKGEPKEEDTKKDKYNNSKVIDTTGETFDTILETINPDKPSSNDGNVNNKTKDIAGRFVMYRVEGKGGNVETEIIYYDSKIDAVADIFIRYGVRPKRKEFNKMFSLNTLDNQEVGDNYVSQEDQAEYSKNINQNYGERIRSLYGNIIGDREIKMNHFDLFITDPEYGAVRDKVEALINKNAALTFEQAKTFRENLLGEKGSHGSDALPTTRGKTTGIHVVEDTVKNRSFVKVPRQAIVLNEIGNEAVNDTNKQLDVIFGDNDNDTENDNNAFTTVVNIDKKTKIGKFDVKDENDKVIRSVELSKGQAEFILANQEAGFEVKDVITLDNDPENIGIQIKNGNTIFRYSVADTVFDNYNESLRKFIGNFIKMRYNAIMSENYMDMPLNQENVLKISEGISEYMTKRGFLLTGSGGSGKSFDMRHTLKYLGVEKKSNVIYDTERKVSVMGKTPLDEETIFATIDESTFDMLKFNEDWVESPTASSAVAMFQNLFLNNGKFLLMDDADGSFFNASKSQDLFNFFKTALDTTVGRLVGVAKSDASSYDPNNLKPKFDWVANKTIATADESDKSVNKTAKLKAAELIGMMGWMVTHFLTEDQWRLMLDLNRDENLYLSLNQMIAMYNNEKIAEIIRGRSVSRSAPTAWPYIGAVAIISNQSKDKWANIGGDKALVTRMEVVDINLSHDGVFIRLGQIKDSLKKLACTNKKKKTIDTNKEKLFESVMEWMMDFGSNGFKVAKSRHHDVSNQVFVANIRSLSATIIDGISNIHEYYDPNITELDDTCKKILLGI